MDWEEQQGEIEALEVIFPDEFKLTQEKPYKFEIEINSNADKEINHLKMLLIVELPYNYPNDSIPFMRLKNLSPDFLDNKMLDQFETEVREKAHDSVGMPVIFEVCEHLREKISDINDNVVSKFN